MVTLQDIEVPEEVFENVLIGFHLKCMQHYGYIISQQERNKTFQLFKGALFMGSYIVFCYLMLSKLSEGFSNLSEGSTSFATSFTVLSTTVAFANAFFQRKRLVRMVIFLNDDITELFRITDKEEELMLNATKQYIHMMLKVMWTASMSGGFLIAVDTCYLTIFKPETVFNMNEVCNGTARPILIFQLFPFAQDYDSIIIGYFGAFYLTFLMITAVPCWHTFVACLMKYVVLKYDIIYKRLKDYDFAKLSFDIKHEELKFLPAPELHFLHTKMCGFCIREQAKQRWFAQELESLIRVPVFFDIVVYSVIMCFLFYSIIAGNPSNLDYIFFAVFVLNIVFLLYLYHWHATLVTESHDRLRFALYCCPWYTFPINVQKNILLMMMESTKPLIMQAFFFDINWSTFIEVVRAAFRYFSLLRNVNME